MAFPLPGNPLPRLFPLLWVVLLPVVAWSQESGPDYLGEVYTCQSPGYQVPYVTHNGSEVIYASQGGVTGRDPKTSLVRWQGGKLKHLRLAVDRPEEILFVGEHVEMIAKARGETVWDFPLNCFPGECNADVVARTDQRLLIGGFGQVYNMITPLDLATGKEIWPSWLSVCPFSQAAFLDDSVILLCTGPGSVLQRIELSSRKTLYAPARPQTDFVPQRLFASSRYLFVEGDAGGQRKLAVYATADGRQVRTFKVKVEGDSVGFLVSPEQGRFVPWQRKGPDWLVWGMDAESGEVIWHQSLPGARLLGQVGATAVVIQSGQASASLVGLDLATGTSRYQLPVPDPAPRTLLQGGQLLIGLADGPFLVVDAQDGRPLHVGQLTAARSANKGPSTFATTPTHFLLLDDQQVTVYQGVPLVTRTDAVTASLDDGKLEEALEQYRHLAPFRDLVPAVDAVRQELASFRFLQALGAVRTGQLSQAIALVQPWLNDHRTGPLTEFAHHLQHLLRVAMPMALVNDGTADGFLLEVLTALVDRSRDPQFFMLPEMDHQRFVATAIALALGIANSPQNADAFAHLRSLHERSELAPILEGNPYWTHFLVAEVGTTLAAVREASRIGDFSMAANFLHDLARLPLANEIFGATYDPWIDAQGAYLMPADIQARKVPGLLVDLDKKLAASTASLLKETAQEVCAQRCRLAGRVCPGTCTLDEECQKATQGCLNSCTRDRLRYQPPQFIIPPGSAGFPACR